MWDNPTMEDEGMSGQIPVRIDSKGRISLPQKVRSALKAKAGDTLFLKCEGQGHLVRMVRAVEDPVAVLWEHAEKEYKAGRTKNLRDYARKKGLIHE